MNYYEQGFKLYKTPAELWEEHITLIDEAVNRKEDSHKIFVDGGCGKEEFVSRYSGQFENCIGIDIDIQLKKDDENIHYIKGDLESIPLRSDSVDVFLTNFVLEHIKHPERFFSEVSRVMKKNGLFIAWTPNADSISGVVIRLLPFSVVNNLKKAIYNAPSHPTYYLANSPLKLDAMLDNSGFRKVQMEMIDSVFYLSEHRLIRWFHYMFIKLTDREDLNRFKDLIFAVYVKSE